MKEAKVSLRRLFVKNGVDNRVHQYSTDERAQEEESVDARWSDVSCHLPALPRVERDQQGDDDEFFHHLFQRLGDLVNVLRDPLISGDAGEKDKDKSSVD